MAEQQSKRQGESRQGESMMARSGEGERGLATRQYQDPFSLLDSMFDRLQRDFFGTTLFNALLPRANEAELGFPRVPRVQIRDAGDTLELAAELPGLDAKDVQVELEDDVLTIRGETRAEEERDGGRAERYITFYRQMQLPDGIDAQQAEASHKNGILTIRFPKRAERSNVRQIAVNTETQQTSPQTGQQAKERAA